MKQNEETEALVAATKFKFEPYWKTQPLQLPQHNLYDHYDVIIVGGGLCGAATLYWLNKLTSLKCLLIEKNQVGGRSTSRSLGSVNIVPDVLLNSEKDDAFLQRIKIATDNRELLKEAIIGHKCGLVCNGGLHVATSEKQQPRLETIQRCLSENGMTHECLTSQELYILTGAKSLYEGLYYPGEMTVNPVGVLGFLLFDALHQARQHIVENTKVVYIDHGNKRISVGTDGGTRFTADHVILSANESWDFITINPEPSLKPMQIFNEQLMATEQSEMMQLTYPIATRTLSGQHAWSIVDDRVLYSYRCGTPAETLDYTNYGDREVNIADAFLKQYFGTIKPRLVKEKVWTNRYLKNGLFPVIDSQLKEANSRLLFNVGYDYSFMDLFFYYAKKIALYVGHGEVEEGL